MGRSPLRTVLDMVNVVFVLSESIKLENPPPLLNILKVMLTLAFSSTASESRFTCTAVRPFGIVTIGIRAARV